MRITMLGAILVAAVLPTAARTQHVIFEEDFENGLPATWTNIHNATILDPWAPGFGFVDVPPMLPIPEYWPTSNWGCQAFR